MPPARRPAKRARSHRRRRNHRTAQFSRFDRLPPKCAPPRFAFAAAEKDRPGTSVAAGGRSEPLLRRQTVFGKEGGQCTQNRRSVSTESTRSPNPQEEARSIGFAG